MNYAIVSLIDQTAWQAILGLIPESREAILNRKAKTDFTHFSWLVSKNLEVTKVKRSLQAIAKQQSHFTISSGGVGVFPGENPVISFLLARNSVIDHLQTRIWKKCQKNMTEINPYYFPDVWMPHVTLFHHGMTSQDYETFFRTSVYSPINFELRVDNLAIIFQNGDSAGIVSYHELTGKGTLNESDTSTIS